MVVRLLTVCTKLGMNVFRVAKELMVVLKKLWLKNHNDQVLIYMIYIKARKMLF